MCFAYFFVLWAPLPPIHSNYLLSSPFSHWTQLNCFHQGEDKEEGKKQISRAGLRRRRCLWPGIGLPIVLACLLAWAISYAANFVGLTGLFTSSCRSSYPTCLLTSPYCWLISCIYWPMTAYPTSQLLLLVCLYPWPIGQSLLGFVAIDLGSIMGSLWAKEVILWSVITSNDLWP